MSIRFLNIAWSSEVTPSQKLVLLSLADQCNDDGVCWPSVSTITSRTSMAERTVFAALKDLEALGFLRRLQREGKSTYYLLLDPCKSCTPANPAVTPASAAVTPAAAAPITINNQQEPNNSLPAIAAKPAKNKTIRGTRLDPNQPIPFEWLNWAIEQGLSKSQAEVEGDKFRDFWAAKTGPNATKLDWPATWRNWIRNSRTRYGNNPAPNDKSKMGFIERITDNSWADGL